jgi:hypothetical protein
MYKTPITRLRNEPFKDSFIRDERLGVTCLKYSGVYGVMMITSSTTLAMATGFVYLILPRPHARRGQRKHSQRSKVSFVCNPRLAFR